MKRILLVTFLVVSATNIFAQQAFQSLAIGSSIPMAEVKMKSIDGKNYSIKDLMKKNGVMVMFSCNTCPIVVKYQSRTLEAIAEAKKNGFGVILINSNEDYRGGDDSYSAMQAYAKRQGYDVPYVVDDNSAVADAFGATRTPETFLFNTKGQLIYHGAMDDNQEAAQATRKHLATAISEAVNGKEVSVSKTRSVGCSIKRKA